MSVTTQISRFEIQLYQRVILLIVIGKEGKQTREIENQRVILLIIIGKEG